MSPRFVNPYFLAESSIAVSRKDIYAEKDDEEIFDADPQLVCRLNELLDSFLGLPLEASEQERSKRKDVQSPLSVQQEEPIAFRLVSSANQPHPILLRPKSPPPPITREPEIEDNEAQASLREERAKASAVDGMYILSRNDKFAPRFGDERKLKRAKVTSSSLSLPVMMIIESEQQLRSTRPPVPESQLHFHPYKQGKAVPPLSRTSTPCCTVVEVVPTSTATTTALKRKRRKKARRELGRPAPAFWRPNPAVGGKSLGYAMGSPCSVEVLRNGSNSFTKYPRDTMRKFGPTI